MKRITITIKETNTILAISKNLLDNRKLSGLQQTFLSNILSQILTAESTMIEESLPEDIEILSSDRNESQNLLLQWRNLFNNIPGFNFAPNCYILTHDSNSLVYKNVVMIAAFAPSMSYNKILSNEAYEVRFKDDGTARFWFPTFEDAEQYPKLFNFKGSWKEAYLLLIDTLKKGWPMEKFPEELQKFLPKD